MKKILLLLCMLPVAAFADPQSNNGIVKDCLDVYGFDRDAPIIERFNFDFSAASNCVAGYNYQKHIQKVKERKEFLKQNPWFKGTNWKWQETAEYTCKHVNTLQGSAVICQKPYYIN